MESIGVRNFPSLRFFCTSSVAEQELCGGERERSSNVNVELIEQASIKVLSSDYASDLKFSWFVFLFWDLSECPYLTEERMLLVMCIWDPGRVKYFTKLLCGWP